LLDEVFSDLLNAYVPQADRNWAGSVVAGLDAADIDWINAPDVSLKNNSGLKLCMIRDEMGWQMCSSVM
jgi:hypothetical protein